MNMARILLALACQVFMATICYLHADARGILLPMMVLVPMTMALFSRRLLRDLRTQLPVETFTKLLTRNAGHERLGYEALRTETLGQPLAVLTVKVVGMDGIGWSDLNKHDQRRILVEAAGILTDVIGVVDIAIYWGEGTFLVLLPGQGKFAATEVGEELDERFRFETPGGVRFQGSKEVAGYDTATDPSPSQRFVDKVLALLK
jgi:GGDEF domain-containing protein